MFVAAGYVQLRFGSIASSWVLYGILAKAISLFLLALYLPTSDRLNHCQLMRQVVGESIASALMN